MNAIFPEALLALLLICMIGEVILAALYLRARSLSISQTVVWVLVILLVPLLGPFLAIALRPGQPLRPSPSGRAALQGRPWLRR
jgi:hypothetical protein